MPYRDSRLYLARAGAAVPPGPGTGGRPGLRIAVPGIDIGLFDDKGRDISHGDVRLRWSGVERAAKAGPTAPGPGSRVYLPDVPHSMVAADSEDLYPAVGVHDRADLCVDQDAAEAAPSSSGTATAAPTAPMG